MEATRSHDDVLDSGMRFLCLTQQDDGRWSDFDTLAGPSDEWVTAIAVSALAVLPVPPGGKQDVEGALTSAGKWLSARQRDDGGWGYSDLVPSDADSTSHVRAALSLIPGTLPGVLAQADSFLALHEDAAGRLHTYADEAGIRAYTGVDDAISFAGWTSAHPCVTAYAASTLPPDRRRRLVEALRHWQREDGSWPAYWWSDRTSATRWAAEAITGSSGKASAADRPVLASAEAWLRHRGQELMDQPSGSLDGTAYPLAHVLAGLITLQSERASIDQIAAHLRMQQCDDGSWPSSARLRIPPPDVVDPEALTQWSRESGGGASINSDLRRIVTTATALGALARHASLLAPAMADR